MSYRITGLLHGALLMAAVTACARGNAADKAGSQHAPTQDAVAPAIDTAAALEPGELHAVASIAVQGRSGPGEQPFEIALRTVPTQLGHSRRFGKRVLDISLRAGARVPELYPCSSCHMGRGQVMNRARIEDAHQDVRPVHPAATGATCATCHAPDNVELLALVGGTRATLDHAYQLCAQCHSPQVEAWSNGAHGKRLDGWQGRRVVMNCADCHDPHAPALRPRMPFRPPRVQRAGSNDHE